jgi:hypothetical protein
VKQTRDRKEAMDYLVAHSRTAGMVFHEMARDGEEITSIDVM